MRNEQGQTGKSGMPPPRSDETARPFLGLLGFVDEANSDVVVRAEIGVDLLQHVRPAGITTNFGNSAGSGVAEIASSANGRTVAFLGAQADPVDVEMGVPDLQVRRCDVVVLSWIDDVQCGNHGADACWKRRLADESQS